jgi:predicted nuclease of restriction endonuclease-like RecB superfamily
MCKAGLTLGGLAEKLGTLTERLGELERENAGLRQKVAALTGSGKNEAVVESAWDSEGRVSRRALFGKAGPPPWRSLRRGH